MKRQLVTLTIALLGTLSQLTGAGAATTMSDYTALPPFIADSVVPNVLLLLDKSGSMGRRADCDLGTGAAFNTCPTFVETKTYTGLFNPLKCYTYDLANTRFDPIAATKASVSATCNSASSEWDGNFLNWVTLRRIDAFKLAWIGGSCAVGRNADGTCPASGAPAKITLKGVDRDVFNSGDTMTTSAIPTAAGVNSANGRMPDAVIITFPANTPLFIHLVGNNLTSGIQTLVGSFCVDDDLTPPRENNANCSGTEIDGSGDSGTRHNQPFKVRMTVSTQSTGVVQEVGEKVRFGLTEFLGNDGAYVLVPIGGRQVKPWNQPTAAVTTYTTNVVAIVQAIEGTNNEGNTPLAESLYESLRYIAQVDSSFTTTQYRHPFGFSPAVALGVNGRGSTGSGEIKVLSGSEVCPTNLPAPYTAQAITYVTNACGRDPFFYGSEYDVSQPTGWAAQSQIVLCCKTFIIVSTDGEPTQDLTIPAGLQTFAGAAAGSGTPCTGGSTTIHAPNGTCNTNPATPPNILLGEHKTDYASSGSHYLNDVAYWGHIRDLRQASLPDIGGTGHDFPGKQNVTIYSFFTFGNIAGRELLMHTAMQGGFDDKNGNDIPDAGEWDTVINATGAAGSDGIPDTFFESSDAAEIKDKLTQTFTSILQRTSSGTSLSVLATSSTGDGALYQSYFYPEYIDPVLTVAPKWVGFTHGLFVDTFGNIREDTTNDGGLNYYTDRILKTHFDSASNKLLVDYYTDTDGNGLPDDRNSDNQITTADCFPCNQPLSALTPMWEAGKRLALTAPADRRILTWTDSVAPVWNGVVDSGEVISFEQSNCTTLKDYLQASTDTCPGDGTGAAEKIINFIRGTPVSGMRNRQVTVGGGPQTWKLGDPIHSTPTEVGPPRERYDVIYGDAGYSKFYQKWRDRRRVIYMGANDGMLHALNGGFYHRGDNPGTTGVTEVEHGWFDTTAVSGTRGDNLGDELWGFIPMQLLPHLKWLTQANYTHVYYVDLKPKITEARIFTEEVICATDHLNAACKHPGGWGTILIGGMRMGGSCGNCQVGKGAPTMTVNIGGTDRDFYSAYFVLDITDPENDPKLLWTFSSAGFGLTTGYPAVLRVNQNGPTDTKTSSTNEKWFMVVGSGPNSYTADFAAAGAQTPTIYAIDLKTGPGAANVNVKTYLAESANPLWKGFMGEVITFDRDLDFRVDAAYFGSVIHDGALPWRGRLYRLTMGAAAPFGAETDPTLWGATGQLPTVLVNLLPAPPPPPASPPQPELGPISSAPGITLDDANRVWVFAGTGRYFSMADKTDPAPQYFIGVKDEVMDGTTPACAQTAACGLATDLLNVSTVTVCQVGVGGCTQANQVTGLATPTSFQNGATSIVGQVQSKDGWYTTLVRTRERVIANPIVLGGVVFFPSFVPDNDVCSTSGDSYLFALYYKTGSAYQDPVIGATGGINNKSVYLDRGVSSSVAIHIGSQGPGGNPSAVQGCIQASSAAISCVSMSPPGSVSSRYITWSRQRD